MPDFNSNNTLVIGAGGGLGQALIKQLVLTRSGKIYAVSRKKQSTELSSANVGWHQCDYSEQQIKKFCTQLLNDEVGIDRVFICNGVLHGKSYWPEKRLEEIDAGALLTVFQANALVPMIWLKYLLPVLTGRCNCKVAIFSARVGSISDNNLGGWYSYRASKAALNMLLKSTAVEFSRRAKNVKLLAFHPGTTDTPLSKPFQERVPADKLFTPDFVARQLLQIMDELDSDGQLSYLDWAGKPIPW